MVYRLRDMLLSQHAYLTAMADYTAHGGQSVVVPCTPT